MRKLVMVCFSVVVACQLTATASAADIPRPAEMLSETVLATGDDNTPALLPDEPAAQPPPSETDLAPAPEPLPVPEPATVPNADATLPEPSATAAAPPVPLPQALPEPAEAGDFP